MDLKSPLTLTNRSKTPAIKGISSKTTVIRIPGLLIRPPLADDWANKEGAVKQRRPVEITLKNVPGIARG
jgi:hypothetical protein